MMEIFSMIVLTMPLIFPAVMAMGYDPIWFGVICVRMMEIVQISPPVGLNVFVIKGVAKNVPLAAIYRGVIPFLIADLVQVSLLIAFPKIVLFLPNMMK